MPPIILSDNLLDDAGTLSASDTDSGYSVNNLIDLRTYSFWQAANTTDGKWIKIVLDGTAAADTIGIFGHNFYTAMVFTIKVEHSSNGTDWTAALTSADELKSDRAFVKTFTSPGAKKYWRISLNTEDASDFTAKPKAAIIMLGTRISFSYPPDSPFIPARAIPKSKSEISEEGHLLGSILQNTKIKIEPIFSLISETFLETYFFPWWKTYGRHLKPFFWAHDLTNYPELAFLVRLSEGSEYQDPRSQANYIDSFSLSMEGLLED